MKIFRFILGCRIGPVDLSFFVLYVQLGDSPSKHFAEAHLSEYPTIWLAALRQP